MRLQLPALAAFALAAIAFAAPAALAQTRTVYEVHFADNSTVVDKKAGDIIVKALPHIRKCEGNGIMVTGHTDTFLDADKSSVLATERARSVRNYLMTKGVADSAIAWRGHSESTLAVPTRDGVKEPKNNRVEIRVVCD